MMNEVIWLIIIAITALILLFRELIKDPFPTIPYCPKCDRTHLTGSKKNFCVRCGTKLIALKRYVFCKCGKKLLDIYYYKDLFAMTITNTTQYCRGCGVGYTHEELIEKRVGVFKR